MPPWMLAVELQAGGLAMSSPSVVGAVLRLEANADKARKDLATLRRKDKVLAGLVMTHGAEYTRR
jgi:hypothetical protein